MAARRWWKSVIVALGLAGSCLLPARGLAGVEEALIAIERQSFLKAFKELKPLADEGDPVAQKTLGDLYRLGRAGGPFQAGDEWAIDVNEAAKWYRRAAEQGHPGAQYALAELLLEGWHVNPDPIAAVEWFGLAAEKGNTRAQARLGMIYEDVYGFDKGLPFDLSRAAELYQAAAEKGDSQAQIRLGSMYAIGKGVEKDLERAHHWYSLAFKHATATKGRPEAFVYLFWYRMGEEPWRQKEMFKWIHRSAEQGLVEAQEGLAPLHIMVGLWDEAYKYFFLDLASELTLEELKQIARQLLRDDQQFTQQPALSYYWFSVAAAKADSEETQKALLKERDLAAGLMSPDSFVMIRTWLEPLEERYDVDLGIH